MRAIGIIKKRLVWFIGMVVLAAVLVPLAIAAGDTTERVPPKPTTWPDFDIPMPDAATLASEPQVTISRVGDEVKVQGTYSQCPPGPLSTACSCGKASKTRRWPRKWPASPASGPASQRGQRALLRLMLLSR